MSEVLVAAGLSTGMFYTASAGESLPSYPTADLSGTGWKEVGDIAEAGISLKLPSGDVLRNWALQAKRKINTQQGQITAPIMDTTKKVFETIFGSSNVTATAATSSHGALTAVTLSPDVSAEAASYLFLIKDGDVTVMLGCNNALITDIADVNFTGTDAVNWNVTIDGDWTIIIDDGQVTS